MIRQLTVGKVDFAVNAKEYNFQSFGDSDVPMPSFRVEIDLLVTGQ